MTSNRKITCTKKVGQSFRIFYNEAEVEALGLQVGDIVEITTVIIKESEPDPESIDKRLSKAPRGTPPEIATRWGAFATLMKNLSKEHPQGISEISICIVTAKEMEVDAAFTRRLLNSFWEVGEIFEPKKGFWLWSN